MANLTLTVGQYAERKGIKRKSAERRLHELIDSADVTLGTPSKGEQTFVVPDTEFRTYNE